MKTRSCILFLAFLALTACSEYQKVLKSKDVDYKYDMALQYFSDKEYVKAQTLLDDVAAYYKGTERSQDVTIYLARSYMGQKDYTSAADYYQAYIRNYPKGKYAAEAAFQTGHCYFLDAPDPRLDQDYMEAYPDNAYVPQALEEQNKLYDRLAYKELLNAQLYYKLGMYLGNNYLSCEITARNALKDYPSNSYQEEFAWLIFASKYQQVIHSVSSKLQERLQDAEDEYYSFTTEYPKSKYKQQAERWGNEIKKMLKRF